jgi:hypothetical protein
MASNKSERVKIMGKRKKNFKVMLIFQDASEYKFYLSKNEANKSHFLKNIIEDLNESVERMIMYVDSSLYKNIRFIDIQLFILLLTGKKDIYSYIIRDEKKQNYKDVWRLCNSFMIDEELPFVKVLNEYYNPQANPEIV